jgi:hypothetical protein
MCQSKDDGDQATALTIQIEVLIEGRLAQTGHEYGETEAIGKTSPADDQADANVVPGECCHDACGRI